MLENIKINESVIKIPPEKEEPDKALSNHNPDRQAIRKQVEEQAEADGERLTELEIQQAVDRINHAMSLFSKRIRVVFSEGEHEKTAKVLDLKTSELLREVPIDKIMELDSAIQDTLGIFVDEIA
ncbi:MAG: flagellar protein FlaG [Candidatus Wallbacteria bacterium]|nr:flagellar protein FlaG [Candidatus Wallbacteria bacterium]